MSTKKHTSLSKTLISYSYLHVWTQMNKVFFFSAGGLPSHLALVVAINHHCMKDLWVIITLVRHKKPGSTAKCMVRHKKARFDTKMPGSTQKCPPQHAPVDIAIIKHPHSCEKYFFPFFFPILRPNREMKMKLYWYEFKISIFNIIMKFEM